jgi:hypothetical protein
MKVTRSGRTDGTASGGLPVAKTAVLLGFREQPGKLAVPGIEVRKGLLDRWWGQI